MASVRSSRKYNATKILDCEKLAIVLLVAVYLFVSKHIYFDHTIVCGSIFVNCPTHICGQRQAKQEEYATKTHDGEELELP